VPLFPQTCSGEWLVDWWVGGLVAIWCVDLFCSSSWLFYLCVKMKLFLTPWASTVDDTIGTLFNQWWRANFTSFFTAAMYLVSF
jgi:hypothetical protein